MIRAFYLVARKADVHRDGVKGDAAVAGVAAEQHFDERHHAYFLAQEELARCQVRLLQQARQDLPVGVEVAAVEDLQQGAQPFVLGALEREQHLVRKLSGANGHGRGE